MNQPFASIGVVSLTVCVLGLNGCQTPNATPRSHKTPHAVQRGLEWLAAHQDDDGRFDADGFMKHDEGTRCDGAGNPVHDVGVTSLALFAFLGDGNTMRSGPYKDTVKKAVKWLRSQQGSNGLYGTPASHDFIYDHAIAAFVMCEAYGLSGYKPLRRTAQSGINYLESHRNAFACWRYQPRDNDNDWSVTMWCVMAYCSAKDFGLQVNPRALEIAKDYLDQLTDPQTGRCGYTKRGEMSSRHPGDHGLRFPVEKGETLTAAALMTRFRLGQAPRRAVIMRRAANVLLTRPPVWSKTGDINHLYWYYGTNAMYMTGGDHWKKWHKALVPAVDDTQRKDGNYKGSWDPAGVWGEDGGRIYATALMVLTLESHYRYSILVK